MLAWNRLITIIVIALFIGGTSNAAYSEEEKKINIGLNITADNELKNELTSYISRELRALGDVSISEYSNDYEINIISGASKSQNGKLFGYVISFVIKKPFDKETIRTKLKEEYQRDSLVELDNLYDILEYSLIATPPNGLSAECQSLVANFDTNHLAKIREWRNLRKEYEKKRETIKEIFKDFEKERQVVPKK
jgi:hypothetical protein